MLLLFAFIISEFYLLKLNTITSKQRPATRWYQLIMLLQTDKIKRSKIAGDSMTTFDLL